MDSQGTRDEAGEWPIAEPDWDTVTRDYDRPLDALAEGEIAAVVLRNHSEEGDCRALIERCIRRGLLYDPNGDGSAELDAKSIPEGYFREGTENVARQAWDDDRPTENKRRIDIGSSLGYRGSDQEAFFEHAAHSRAIFAELFAGMPDLIANVYGALEALSVDKKVLTAEEPDGRQYCPAIIRAHYGGYAYRPHFDSVRNREKRTDYSVHNFDHQFAGVLLLQNSEFEGRTAQSRIHRCFWNPEVAPYLQENRFHEYAESQGIANRDVILQPGDLYFFNTGCIHEVPPTVGEDARIVLAMFIGYSADSPVIHVWS